MRYEIIDQLSTDLKALNFVDRFGGLVQKVKKNLSNDPESLDEITFPVSCDTDPVTCFETGKYQELIPDSNHNSIMYFEDVSGLSEIDRSGSRRKIVTMGGNFKMVVWLNLAAMGFEDCTSPAQFVGQIRKILEARKPAIMTPSIVKSIKWKVNGIAQQSENIFSGYTYDDKQELFLYPYMAFSLDLELTFRTTADCVADVTVTPSDCLDIDSISVVIPVPAAEFSVEYFEPTATVDILL